MNKMKNKDSIVRISLIDVMYGVVLAYGFEVFDQANTTIDYIRFFFAYAVIIIDWLYVHRLYLGWGYKHNSFFLLDMGILFTISRLLHTSTAPGPHYLLWLSILFVLYFVWDILSKYIGLPSEYDWRYSIGGDIFATLSFFVLWALVLSDRIQFSVFWTIATVAIYTIALSIWFKKKV